MNKSNLLHPIVDGFQEKPGIELADLFAAYADCRRNKRRTMNALAFEVDYERELIALHKDINAGIYLNPLFEKEFIYDSYACRAG